MSVRGVLIRNDSVESNDEFPAEISTAPRTPKTPRSPHPFGTRIDYFDRCHSRGNVVGNC